MRVHLLLRNVALTIAAGLCSSVVFGQGIVNPLKTVPAPLASIPVDRSLNMTDNPVVVPVATGTNMKQFHAGNVIKIDSEYFTIMTVTVSPQDNTSLPGFAGYSSVTATRAQLGSIAAAHGAQSAVLRVYQLDVSIASPNAPIGAYQLNVNYDAARLSIIQVNVFPGDPGPLQNPIAMNTNTPGVVILNSFNADTPFQGPATSVARLYFTGTGSGTANVSVNFTSLEGASANDLDPVSNSVSTTLSASSLDVMTLAPVKRRLGQITSQN
jgi:hypothetical protein